MNRAVRATYLKNVVSTKLPKEIDLGLSPPGFYESSLMKGIYEIDGNQLMYCLARPNQPRPTEFEVPPNSGRTLVRLERFRTGEAEIEKALTKQGVMFSKDEIGWITDVKVSQNHDSNSVLELIAPLNKLKSFAGGAVTKKGATYLSQHKQLEKLVLYSDTLEDSDFEFLIHLEKLWSVSIGSPKLTDDCLQHFQSLLQLGDLRLYQTRITIDGLKRLPAPAGMHRLEFTDRELDDADVQSLCELFPNLDGFNLRDSKITDACMEYLGQLNLTSLHLGGTGITDAGLSYLAACTKIRRLNLSGTTVSEKGLSQLGALVELRFLTIRDTVISDAGLAAIADSFPNLRNLDARGSQGFTGSGLLALNKLKDIHYFRVSKGTLDEREILAAKESLSPHFRVIQD